MDHALHGQSARQEEACHVAARAQVVDADIGPVGPIRAAAVDEQDRLAIPQHRIQLRAGDGAQQDGGADQLRPHFQQIFVLEVGAVMRVA